MSNYVTATELKAFSAVASLIALSDAAVDKLIVRAMRMIDAYCGQTFSLSTSEIEYVNGSGSTIQKLSRRLVTLSLLRFLDIQNGDEIVSAIEIEDVFNKNWWLEAGDDKVPLRNRIGKDYNNGLLCFPEGSNNIEITGTWGYATVPDEVKDATCLTVETIYASQQSAGVMSNGFKSEDIGDYSYDKGDMNPDRNRLILPEAQLLLAKYKKPLIPAVL